AAAVAPPKRKRTSARLCAGRNVLTCISASLPHKCSLHFGRFLATDFLALLQGGRTVTASLGQGWSGILIAYGLSTGGLYGGLRMAGQNAGRALWILKCSVPVLLAAKIVTTIITEGTRALVPGLPRVFGGLLGLVSLVLASGAIGLILLRRGHQWVHQRGTRLLEGIRRRGR